MHFVNFGTESDLDMPEFIDYYQLLGLNYNCSSKEIDTAYLSLMNSHHPDINKKENFTSLCAKLNEAYSVLKNPKKDANMINNIK